MGDAKIATIDFSKAESIRLHASGRVIDRGDHSDARPTTPEGKLLTPKQIRARARRRAAKARKDGRAIMSDVEFEALYKPVDEWDMEELARGRPRDMNGKFQGRKPGWITREVHERAMEQFQSMIKSEMAALTPTAVERLQHIMNDDSTDDRGKPIVPASVKFQAISFLLEHQVGKPKQHVQQDISVKLQGILGAAMVNPHEAMSPPNQGGEGMNLAHFPGHTIPIGTLGQKEDIVDGEVLDDDADLDEGNE